MSKVHSTIDQSEIDKFSKISDEWWDLQGKFKPLHEINRTRLDFIRQQIIEKFKIDANKKHPLQGLKILDVGCGGGILAEPLARLGAEVTAIDASESNIKVAALHAKEMELDINYQVTTIEELAKTQEKYDVILAMEVLEHVADVQLFIDSCCFLLKDKSLFFLSTINRTIKSYAMAIIGAEYILRWLPIGTHDWHKFLKPSEISNFLAKNERRIVKMQGMCFNIVSRSWELTDNVDVNYLLCSDI